MTPPPPTRPQSLARRLVPLLAGGVAAVAAVSLAGRANAIEVPLAYHRFWSAGWLTLRGENPYDPVRMFEVQKPAGLKDQFAALSWHPPWTLVLTLPFGLLPVPAGWLAWSAVQLAAVTGVLFVCLANGKRMAITDYVFVTPLVAAAVVTVVWMTPYRRPAAAPIL